MGDIQHATRERETMTNNNHTSPHNCACSRLTCASFVAGNNASAASRLTTGRPVSLSTPRWTSGVLGSKGTKSGGKLTRPVSSPPVSTTWGLWLARSGRVDGGGCIK
jgi:hypothetical protein